MTCFAHIHHDHLIRLKMLWAWLSFLWAVFVGALWLSSWELGLAGPLRLPSLRQISHHAPACLGSVARRPTDPAIRENHSPVHTPLKLTPLGQELQKDFIGSSLGLWYLINSRPVVLYEALRCLAIQNGRYLQGLGGGCRPGSVPWLSPSVMWPPGHWIVSMWSSLQRGDCRVYVRDNGYSLQRPQVGAWQTACQVKWLQGLTVGAASPVQAQRLWWGILFWLFIALELFFSRNVMCLDVRLICPRHIMLI